MGPDELAAELAKHPLEAVVAALKARAGSVFTAIDTTSFNNGYGKKAGELDTAKARVTELETQVTTLTATNQRLSADKPDIGKMESDHRAAIADLKEKQKTVLGAKDQELERERTSTAQAMLTSMLRVSLNDVYADNVAGHADTRSRLKPGPDGKIQVMQAGKDIPMTGATLEENLKALADEKIASAPTTMKLANVDRGAGDASNNGAPHRVGSTVLDKVRTDAEARTKQTAQPKHTGPFAGFGNSS